MKHIFTFILSIGLSTVIYAQQEFHVFPKTHSETPGKNDGTGSIDTPWDLQTALSQTPEVVNSGDTIWLHEGVYTGRFISRLKSLDPNQYITVSAFKNDKVVLNGNAPVKQNSVLAVRSTRVIYKNFEVTWLGEFSRDQADADFEFCFGIEHFNGENCRFYNIIIHDNPGLGIGSWKKTAGTIIENCMIFNNGYKSNLGRGAGEGIYVQNKSEETRLIRNNIIFNNYYKGIEVWSAGKRAKDEAVKNITLEGNIIFNSGSPSTKFRDNVIVGTNDYNGINIANNIKLFNNVLYHNTYNNKGKLNGEAPSLTLGFNKKAPIKDIIVDGNVIVGGHDVLRLSIAESLNFSNNVVHGAIQVGPNTSAYLKNWVFDNNTYYTKLKTPFRISKGEKHSLKSWQETYQLDRNSAVYDYLNFDLNPILHLSRHSQKQNKFNVALFNAENNDVTVDFSEYELKIGSSFKIYDAENINVIAKSGILAHDFKITFPMQLTAFQNPLHNTSTNKTLSDFGVFIIEFDEEIQTEDSDEKDNFFKRFWEWLGF